MSILAHYQRARAADAHARADGCRGYFILTRLSPVSGVCSVGIIDTPAASVMTSWGMFGTHLQFLAERLRTMGVDPEVVPVIVQQVLNHIQRSHWAHGFIAQPGFAPSEKACEFTGGSIQLEPSLN